MEISVSSSPCLNDSLGGSDVACGQVPPDVEGVTLRLGCSTGTISTTAVASKTGERLLDIGIINASTEDKTICSHDAFVSDGGDEDEVINCSQFLAKDKIEATMNVECVGKDQCTLDKFNNNFYRKNVPAANSAEFRECFGNGAQVFIQAACVIEEDEIKTRQF